MRSLQLVLCIAALAGLAGTEFARAEVIYTLSGSASFAYPNPAYDPECVELAPDPEEEPGPACPPEFNYSPEDISFTLTTPSFITSNTTEVLDSCSITGGVYSCTTAEFSPSPNIFANPPTIPGTDDFIGFNSSSTSSSGQGYLFFIAGALGLPGVYNSIAPLGTPGFGSFGTATLTVAAVPLPAAAWLFISALGALVAIGRRRRLHGDIRAIPHP